MVASKTPVKKTPVKKSVAVKKSVPKKITLKKDLDEEFPQKKITLKKSLNTEPGIKPSSKTTAKNSPKTTKTVKPPTIDKDKQHKPDEQISLMIEQFSQTISAIAEQSDKREQRSLEMLRVLTDSLQKNQPGTAPNNHSNEIVRRNRIIGLSAATIGTVAILAILYVVNMLGTAMTDISTDIHKIQLSVGDISTRMDSMTLDINSMSGNMQQLNRNITTMSKDLSILSYTLAPSLQGMRGGAPWAPLP
ncbi:MAG: hypothetical protein GY744_06820 [Gammaproteobacteria bacterium]|nr:hypothetical protein [Gammaproteobacteria bacterium]